MASSFRHRTPAIFLLAVIACVAGTASGDDDPRDLAIWKEFGQNTHVDCDKAPLKDLAEYLRDLHSMSFYVDTEAFEKAGIPLRSVVITHKGINMPLWKVLRDMLKPTKASFMIKNHLLTFTTVEAASEWQKKNIGEEK